jgi:hypothetical protein
MYLAFETDGLPNAPARKIVNVVTSRSGVVAPHALLKNTRFGEGPKQYPADLPIEARHLRSVSRGERYTRQIDE